MCCSATSSPTSTRRGLPTSPCSWPWTGRCARPTRGRLGGPSASAWSALRPLSALHRPRHEVPPPGLLPRGRRREPFIYTPGDIAALMAAARRLRSPLRALTMETLIGLLAVIGLRVGEVIRVDREDVDLAHEVLVVRNSKSRRLGPPPQTRRPHRRLTRHAWGVWACPVFDLGGPRMRALGTRTGRAHAQGRGPRYGTGDGPMLRETP